MPLANLFVCDKQKWDALKVMRPNILNDFSFYRRNFAKMVKYDIEPPVSEQQANFISMFLAQPCPFTSYTSKQVLETNDELAMMVFVNLANALCRGVTEEFQSKETLDFACSAMTSAVVICDLVFPQGMFNAKGLKVKAILEALTGYVYDHTFNFNCNSGRFIDRTKVKITIIAIFSSTKVSFHSRFLCFIYCLFHRYGNEGESLLLFLKYNVKSFGQLCPPKLKRLFPE